MTTSITQPLLTPVRMGDLDLRNRIVMAPLTRMRADNADRAPTELHARYYEQRASAGLIIGECTAISPAAYGWADTPGLWSAEQVRGWRGVTDAVHKKGSRIFAQLWHTGALSHPDFFGGALPMSAFNVDPVQVSVTPSGRKPTVAPRPMTRHEIRRTVADFAQAARNAIEAGFGGVQIQANYLYLIAQFFNKATNRRTDEYGGSIENRARFFFEILETVLEDVPANRFGVKTGPMNLDGDSPPAEQHQNHPTLKHRYANHQLQQVRPLLSGRTCSSLVRRASVSRPGPQTYKPVTTI
jgi:N-ethylmaleimide reductase